MLVKNILLSGLKNCRYSSNFVKPNLEMTKPGLSSVVSKLEDYAPLSLAESWDNVGLLVEPSISSPIERILLTNDLTENVVSEAIKRQSSLIISYHPPIFAPLKRITQASWKGRVIGACLENNIAVYSPHTSWDNLKDGITSWLAGAFTSTVGAIEKPMIKMPDSSCLVEVYSGVEDLEVVCDSFITLLRKGQLISKQRSSDGQNSYKLLIEKNQLHDLLTIPDIIVSKFEIVKRKDDDCGDGLGKFLTLDNSITVKKCVELVKKRTGLEHVRLALATGHNSESLIKKVAVVCGSGGSLLKGVTADLYLTGEMLHHDILEANHNGASVILTNHSDSERGFLKHFKSLLTKWFPSIEVNMSECDEDPLKTV